MIALLGGTFDPLHLGHLRAAWEASERLDCPVHLVPAREPPHRGKPQATADERAAIIRAALAGQSRLELDTRELQRDAPSWTADTLRDVRRDFERDEPIVWLVGADAVAGLPHWHRWRDLLQTAHIGVLARPGYTLSLPDELLEAFPDCPASTVDELHAAPHGRVLLLEITSLDISASRVRQLLASGHEPRYLLPDAVFREPALLAPYRCRG